MILSPTDYKHKRQVYVTLHFSASVAEENQCNKAALGATVKPHVNTCLLYSDIGNVFREVNL